LKPWRLRAAEGSALKKTTCGSCSWLGVRLFDGFGVFRAIDARSGRAEEAVSTEIPSPMGPAAATQDRGSGSECGSAAPMMAEITP
jgi:hypothetical protein